MTTTRTASTLRRLAGTVVALGMLAACGQSGAPTSDDPYGAGGSAPSSPPAATSSAPGAPAPNAPALELRVADSSLGPILVDGRGMTLYMFTRDSANTSSCEGQCLVNWPPLLGAPSEGEGVDDSKLGSFTRSDGRVQATYNGWPLYYWVEDTKPGDTTGQNVQGVWFVMNRGGDPVR